MCSHERAPDLQLLDDAIHALHAYTAARVLIPAFPGWPGPVGLAP
jgi:hypothetical protein